MPELFGHPLLSDANLKAYYRFTKGNSNEYFGSFNGTDTNITYNDRGALSNGTTSIITATKSITLPANLTMGGWFYINSITQNKGLFGIGGSAGSYGYKLFMSNGTNASTGNHLVITLPAVANVDSTAVVAAIGWHQILLIRRSSTFEVWIDNVIGGVTTASTPQTPNQLQSILGSYEEGAFQNSFDAYCREFYVLDRALSTAEIASLYFQINKKNLNSLRPRPFAPGIAR